MAGEEITVEEACRRVATKGDLSAARLLGVANIPLPDNIEINKPRCVQIWEIARKQALASQVDLAPVKTLKPLKTAEEIALLKQQREELQRQFEVNQKAIREYQRQQHAAQQEAADIYFDYTATQEFLLEQYQREQQRLQAIKVQKDREAEEVARQKFNMQKRDQRYDLEQEELAGRQRIKDHYLSSTLFEKTYDEIVMAVAAWENTRLLYDAACREREAAFKRIEQQYESFGEYYLALIDQWNFRLFFARLSRLKTEEGDPFHDIRVLASDFCKQQKITMKNAQPGVSFMFPKDGTIHPLLSALDAFSIFPLRRLDPSQHLLSPLKVARFITSRTYGLVRGELSFCEKFIEHCRKAYLLSISDAQVADTNLNFKNPFYNILKCLRYDEIKHLYYCDINQLMDYLEKGVKVDPNISPYAVDPDISPYVNALAILMFKNRHNTFETQRLVERYQDSQAGSGDIDFPGFIITLLGWPLSIHDLVLPSYTTIWDWYLDVKKSFDKTFKESDVHSAFKIDQSEFYSFIWNTVAEVCFSYDQISQEVVGVAKMILGPIHEYFKKMEDVCNRLDLPEEARAQRYVLSYKEDATRMCL